MRILVIGGTRFVGRHITEAALARGHQVVLFNRGRTGPELFPNVEHVRGDRDAGDLDQLIGRPFDALFDTAAYFPAQVLASARLAAHVQHYCLVSTISVYRDPVPTQADESAPLYELDGPVPSAFATPQEYGALKVMCEATAREAWGPRALIVRPGLVVGPHDYTERLTSWLRRLATREQVLAGEPGQPVQLIDVRDLAEWMVRGGERRLTGTFHAVGPSQPITFADLLSTAATALGVRPTVVWAGDEFLTAHNLSLPLWLGGPDHPFFELSARRARAEGLILRPVEQTLVDVAAWDATRPGESQEDGLSALEEQRLLDEFSAKV